MAVPSANLYSFRSRDRVFGSVFQADTPAGAALAALDAKVAAAHADYLDRRYGDAVRDYTDARALVFAQLHPGAPGTLGHVSVDPRLFEPLLSMATEWLNVLPVEQPMAAVRPRVPVDPVLLDDMTTYDAVGLRSAVLSAPGAPGAVADFSLAQTLRADGNAKAAAFFLDRARSIAPDLIAQLEQTDGHDVGGGPAPQGQHLAKVPVDLPVQPSPASPAAPAAVGTLGRVAADAGIGPRVANAATGLLVDPVPQVDIPPALTVQRSVGTVIGNDVATFAWAAGDAPPADAIRKGLYEGRIDVIDLKQVIRLPATPADFALDLPHLYWYVIPLGLAESHHALGDYAAAEAEYLQVANYPYLNLAIEAPYVWTRLATLYLDWGNALFREGDAGAALPVYEHVLSADYAEPASELYTVAALKAGADAARAVIADFAHAASLPVDLAIAAVVAEVRQQLLKIAGGLDFWGFWTNTVPIWTFDYLQSVARDFTQLAVTAERDVISFWDRAGQAALTRQQLVGAAVSSDAEIVAADMQTAAASAEYDAFSAGVALATKRAADARANATEYATQSDLAISYAAASAQVNGGDDGDPNDLNVLADALLGGSTISGSRGTIAAAAQLAGAKANRRYEIDSLQRQADEMDLAKTQAQDESVAARARVEASAAAADVARIRAQNSHDLLDAFDEQFFTADVWQRMGDTMYALYRRYLTMALRAARLMQQAYNFETDQNLQLIRADYSIDEVKGLLGADVLLADIESFTYDLITSTAGKPQPVKQTISLACRYPFAFENQLRTTGVMEFETSIDDFDSLYPGSYAGRIDGVEVAVDGIVPPTGISGTLTNTGISNYRVPLHLWSDPGSSGLKHRVQNKETLLLSDYTARADALLVSSDGRMLKVFQGAGLASSWRLELPKEINDIDYGALLDVRLTLYYKARFDPDLAQRVKADLAGRPGFTARQRAIPVRWLYPDAFFAFQDTGRLTFTLRASDFPNNQTVPVLQSVGVLLATDGSVSATGLLVGLSTPGHAEAKATTDARGGADSTSGGSAYAALVGGSVLGDYTVSLSAADDPTLAPTGTLDLSPLVNVVVLLDYSFTPRS